MLPQRVDAVGCLVADAEESEGCQNERNQVRHPWNHSYLKSLRRPPQLPRDLRSSVGASFFHGLDTERNPGGAEKLDGTRPGYSRSR